MEAIQKHGDGVFAVITTTKGDIVLSLEYQKTPMTVSNFVALAEGAMTGKPYYDGLKFHRVIADFMVQGGCPQGTGTGGPGYTIRAEFNETPHEAGVLSMARTGDPNSAGSQFFLCLERTPHLDRQYTAFGKAADAESLATVKAIGNVQTGPSDRPVQDVVIRKVTVTEKPKG